MPVEKRYSERHGREVWGYAAKIGGKRRQKFGFSSKEAAELALSKARINHFERREGVAAPEERPAVTVKQLVERRRAQLQSTSRRRVTAGVLDRWLATLPAGLALADLKTAHLSAYADERLKTVKPQTVFRELTDVCSMLNRARDLFPSLEDWHPPRRPRMKVPSGARERVITAEEVAAVLRQLRRPREEGETERYHRLRLDAADLLLIALQSAARRMEILSLKWGDVNFERRTLRVAGTKTDRVRTVPMTDSLLRLFERRRAETRPSPLVFPLMACRSMLKSETGLIYQDASERAGVPYGRETPGGWVLHDARHTAITAMLHAGHSLESVMAISGHSARVMTMRYAHSNETTRRAAVAALEQFAA
jgi:integrase